MLVLFILFPAELQALCPSIIFFFSFSDGKTALKSSVCIGLLAFFCFFPDNFRLTSPLS